MDRKNPLDEIAKNKLHDWSVNPSMSDWNRLQKDLDHESALDNAIKKKLESYQENSIFANWTLIESIMQWTRISHSLIPRFKCFEITTVVIFLVLLQIGDSSITIEENLFSLNAGQILDHDQNSDIQRKNQRSITIQRNHKDQSKTSSQSIQENSEFNVSSVGIENQILSIQASNLNAKLQNDPLLSSPQKRANDEVAFIDHNSAAFPVEVFSSDFSSELDITRSTSDLKILEASVLPIKLQQASDLSSNSKQDITPLDPIESGIEFKLDNNKIIESGIIVDASVGFSEIPSAGGMGSGYKFAVSYYCAWSEYFRLKLGLETGRLQFDNSSSYTSKIANEVVSVQQDIQTAFTDLSIPIAAQFILHKTNKWRIYSGFFAVTQFVLEKKYTGTSKATFNGIQIQSDIQSSHPKQGLLHAPNAKNDILCHLGFGLGLERQLSEKMALFVESNISYSLNAIQTDHVSSMNLKFGLKHAF